MLTKGFEVEMYTGTPQADIVGFSDKIVAALDGFVRGLRMMSLILLAMKRRLANLQVRIYWKVN
ncbi:hypothetical protein [Leptolyngbya sp. 7M]|uniref:hypothetical protein n=1 Tax=Leptolyngbya sp. 7M TaxID=2812896 RepID=UPI001B8DA62F|nr:hypothetical protein [Leptolyngbya sp. 7M]QYO68902.1 hypothetical protein JVX88_25875 [Leptolyngbya sp. 7M]